MFYANLFRFFTSVILLGMVVVPHIHAHYGPNNTVRVPPDSEAFLPVSDAHRVAWEQVVDDCLPVNTRTALSASCMTALGEYFPNEPVWSYNYVFVYDPEDGWSALYYNDCNQRRDHSAADFLDPDIPLWSDIFDDQIGQRQELFLRVVNDPVCQELASRETQGIHSEWADQCAAREMYQYAAYLSACLDATQRLSMLQKIVTKPTEGRALTRFELSFEKLDENVADADLRAAAKRHLEKSYLHAAWVAMHCNQHGLVLRPGVTQPAFTWPTGQKVDAYTSTDEKLRWGDLKGRLQGQLRVHTHEFIMKIAMKSGDDWAIRSGYLGRTPMGDLGADLMQRYPLLTHRILGGVSGGFEIDFTWEEQARHRAKAYLLLVEAAGEEFARREYDPEPLAQHIQYVEAGGVLKAPLTRAERIEKRRD